MLKVTATPEFAVLPAQRESVVHLMIRLETAPLPGGPSRLPLNLSLVLDRSGSMGGEKLRATQRAAAELIGKLNATDQVSLVAYDHQVQVLSEPVSGAQKDLLCQAVNALRPGGSTNLSGGWLRGLSLVERMTRRQTTEALHRVLLMTDGQANAGVTGPGDLAAIGRRYLEAGVRTTTLGFGANFNEDLLTSIAEQSGGNFYYIDTPDQAANAFLEELGELSAVVGQNLEVLLHCEPGVKIERSLCAFPGSVGPARATWKLGDLYADDARVLVVALRVPAGHPQGERPIAQVGVRYQGVRGELGPRRVELPAVVGFEDRAGPARPDRSVRRERLVLETAQCKDQAVVLADRGDYGTAQQRLRHHLGDLRGLLAEADLSAEDRALLAAEVQACEDLAEDFTAEGYSPHLRKLTMNQAYQSKKQRGTYRKTSSLR